LNLYIFIYIIYILYYNTDLACYTNFHWFFKHECQHIFVCWIDQVFVTELSVVKKKMYTAVLSIKTAFNLVKIHLLFRIMLLIQWNVIFLSSMLSVFRIYADIHAWRTNENLCNKLNPYYSIIYILYIQIIPSQIPGRFSKLLCSTAVP
jgi:hypothetical protein